MRPARQPSLHEQDQHNQRGRIRHGQQDVAHGGVENGLAQIKGQQQRDGRGQQVAAPFLALPHGGSRDQLGQPEHDQPDRDGGRDGAAAPAGGG